jgi:tripartite-type tricarboxylate transporter receptor subunit TctC
VIENKAGAAGRIAVETVKAAEPDGHTLLLGTAGLMTMFPHAYPGWATTRCDFAPLVNAARFELALVVHQSVPAQTLAEFLAWARTQAAGRAAELCLHGAGTLAFSGRDAQPRRRPAHAARAVQGLDPGAPGRDGRHGAGVFRHRRRRPVHAAPGRVRVLATSGSQRSPALPAVPSFVELGFPEVIATAWFAYFAPARTPPEVLALLRRELLRAVNTREVRQQLLLNGMYPVGDGPEALAQTLREDTPAGAVS